MSEWVRALVSIALVLGLAVAVRWWAGRVRLPLARPRGRRGWERLEPVDRLPLSPRHSLHLVRLGDRLLLIGAHPSGCNLIESLPAQRTGDAERASELEEA
ncbi:MAG: flagellar biosynthetic protein FliO [Bryobacteraceae bacterium]